jgi:hypothetical protein
MMVGGMRMNCGGFSDVVSSQKRRTRRQREDIETGFRDVGQRGFPSGFMVSTGPSYGGSWRTAPGEADQDQNR